MRAAGLSATLTSCVLARPARRGCAWWDRPPEVAPVVGRWLFLFHCLPWCACAGGRQRRWGLPRNQWTDARQAAAAAQRPPHGHSLRARRVATTPTPPPPSLPVRRQHAGASRIGRPLQHAGQAAHPYPPGSARCRRHVSRVPATRGPPSTAQRLRPRASRRGANTAAAAGTRQGTRPVTRRLRLSTATRAGRRPRPGVRAHTTTAARDIGPARLFLPRYLDSRATVVLTHTPIREAAAVHRVNIPSRRAHEGAADPPPRKPHAPWRGRRHRLAPPRQPHYRRHRRPLPAAQPAWACQTAADPCHLPPSLPPIQ